MTSFQWELTDHFGQAINPAEVFGTTVLIVDDFRQFRRAGENDSLAEEQLLPRLLEDHVLSNRFEQYFALTLPRTLYYFLGNIAESM